MSGSTSPPDTRPTPKSPDESELRAAAPALDSFEEFRNLSLLVTVATAINDPNNHSTLTLSGATMPMTLSKTASVMHAMASILVLHHEILACMSEADNKTLLVTQDKETEHGEVYDVDLPAGKVKVTTIANPDERDANPDERGAKLPLYGSCLSLEPGIDHWPSIMRSESDQWDFLGE